MAYQEVWLYEVTKGYVKADFDNRLIWMDLAEMFPSFRKTSVWSEDKMNRHWTAPLSVDLVSSAMQPKQPIQAQMSVGTTSPIYCIFEHRDDFPPQKAKRTRNGTLPYRYILTKDLLAYTQASLAWPPEVTSQMGPFTRTTRRGDFRELTRFL